ncbi:fungal-specific transcription factor domain-containing protein [Pilobolus umbonatus]|nr:fungal-specific transcription factor domain-containing protein [Pilobolus umbonatus]
MCSMTSNNDIISYVDNLEKKCKKMESLLSAITKLSIRDLERNDFRYTGNTSSTDDEEEHQETETGRDYDSIRYTGQSSAGSQLLGPELFKHQSSVHWPGKDNVYLQLSSNEELMIVTKEDQNGKSDVRLNIGLSLNAPYLYPQHPSTSNSYKDPSQQQLDKAIQCYFRHIHTSLPIINKEEFLSQYHQGSIFHLPSSIIVYSIYAVTFRFMCLHEMSSNQQNDHEYATVCFKRVMKKLRDSTRSRLCHVQAALLMTIYLDMDTEDMESIQWYTLGSAIRIAQDLGLHRSCQSWNLPPSEIESRHRVFYACYIMDRWIAARCGKPLTILDRDFDTDIPSPYEISDTNSNNEPIYRPFILLIRLSEVLGRILKSVYSPAHDNLDDPSILNLFNRKLKGWKSSLEETINGFSLSEVNKVHLEIYYYTVVLILHRPFYQSNKDPLPLENTKRESERVCMDAAKRLSQLNARRRYYSNDPDFYAIYIFPSSYVYCLFQASLVYLSNAKRDRNSMNIQIIYQSIDSIQSIRKEGVASRAADIIRMLASVNGLMMDLATVSNEVIGEAVSSPVLTTIESMDKQENEVPKSKYFQHMLSGNAGVINRSLVPSKRNTSTNQPFIDNYPVFTHQPLNIPSRTHMPNSVYTHHRSISLDQPSHTPVYYTHTRSISLDHLNSMTSFHTSHQNDLFACYPSNLTNAPTQPESLLMPHGIPPAEEPNMILPSNMNWNDWDVYLGHQQPPSNTSSSTATSTTVNQFNTSL